MILKIVFHLRTGLPVFLLAVFLSGCAATTEPAVRAYIHEKKAYSEIQAGKLQLASMNLKKALKDNPEEPSILNNMALIAFKEGDTRKAIGFLEQARALKAGTNDEPYILNEARVLIAHRMQTARDTMIRSVQPLRYL